MLGLLTAAAIFLQAGGSGGNVFVSFLPFIAIFVIFYVLLFLPAQKRQKATQMMLANLKSGDRVVTTGGIRGTIVAVKEDAIHIRVPPQDIRLEIARNAVAGLLGDEDQKKSA